MSQVAAPSPSPSRGRAMPRWSNGGQLELLPASIAGLPANRAWVSVGPPLFASGPSLGSVLLRSPDPVKPHVDPLSRLLPCDVIVPAQFPLTELFATMVCLSSAELPASFQIPPPANGAEFPLSVTLLSVAVPKLRSPPPIAAPKSFTIVLPLIVLFLILRLPALVIPAPELAAEFPLIVLSMILSVPLLNTPPPSPKAEFPLIVHWTIVRMPPLF